MAEPSLTEVVGVAVGTGITSAGAVIAALQVHISYIKEQIKVLFRRIEAAEKLVTDAHHKIDIHEARGPSCNA